MAVMHHSIINSRVWIKTQTLSDLTDGCVHAAGPSKTGGGVLEDRGAANPKRVRLCVSVCFYATTCRRKRVDRVARKKLTPSKGMLHDKTCPLFLTEHNAIQFILRHGQMSKQYQVHDKTFFFSKHLLCIWVFLELWELLTWANFRYTFTSLFSSLMHVHTFFFFSERHDHFHYSVIFSKSQMMYCTFWFPLVLE